MPATLWQNVTRRTSFAVILTPALANALRFPVSQNFNDAARLGELRDLLVSVTSTGSLPAALETLARWVERSTTGLCAISLVDREHQRLRFAAAPSLPAAYNAATHEIPIGDGVGSCGTAAATRHPVFVADIAADPLWAPYRDVVAEHGLVACWSQPILDSRGDVLGTFALYHRVVASPSPDERQLLDDAARVAALVIERARTDAARETAEEARHQMAIRLRRVADAVQDVIIVVDAADATIRFANAAALAQSPDGAPWEGRRLDDALFATLAHPDDAPRLMAFVRGTLRDASPEAVVVRQRPIDGVERHIRCRHVVLERDAAGRPSRVLVVGSSIADHEPDAGSDASSSDARHADAVPPSGDGPNSPAARLRGIRVLVVDDEPDVLRVVAKRLQRAGCTIDTAMDGEEALQRVVATPSNWDVLLTDQTMPRRTGEQLLVAMREAGIMVPVVVMSGYSATVTPDRMLAAGASAFLPKPFDGAQLLATLAASLTR